ncbi:MAG: YvcK family protein [Mycoplasma sp.]|nr:YvcK family protein [Mycoplasma sp.]
MNVVVIGGGTGLSLILNGIKYIKGINISAIVSVVDDGGSTGLLSHSFSIPAVGDLRRVIASLSKDRKYLEKSLEYRFKDSNSSLDNHAIGNLLITSEILRTKSFSKGISNISKMLNVSGKIVPVSEEKNILCAKFDDGSIIKGESKIHTIGKNIDHVFFEKKSKSTELASKEIEKADLIILGIGSLYTSIIPNLIYDEVISSLKKSKAKTIYLSNIMTEKGETDNMSIMDHINAIEKHTFKGLIDGVIISDTEIPEDIIEKYNKEGQKILKNDIGTQVAYETFDLINFKNNLIRHDKRLIERAIRQLIKNDIF